MLFAEVGKPIFTLVSEYYGEAAGMLRAAGMVSSQQTFGEYASWHPHWHTIALEGDIDDSERFFFIPISISDALQ